MDFPKQTHPSPLEHEAKRGPHSKRVSWPGIEANSNPCFRSDVLEEPRVRTVLRNGEINTPVVIEIARNRRPLLAINAQTRLLGGQAFELPRAFSAQKQTASRIKAR